MTLCNNCGKEKAVWRHQKYKVVKNDFKYLCDKCLMTLPNTAERIEHYVWIGDEK